MNVMILCGKYGMGHLSAAQAIKEQLEVDIPNITVTIEDFIEYAFPSVNKVLYSGFKFLTTKTPRFYARTYPVVANKEDGILYKQYMMTQLFRFLKKHKPDIIICTLPEVARIVSYYKEQYKSSIPLVTCITDITTFHEWINYGSNLYLVPTNSVRKFLIQFGIKDETIMISGIPVKQKFHHLKHINSDKKQLLIMGGGLGNIPLDFQFYEDISKHSDIEVNVLTAKNKELYEQLNGKYPNVNAIGFTDKVDQFMAKADLVITKTGGISTFECIYAHLPVLTYIPFLPQEKRNAEFLESERLGKIMWNNDKNPIDLVVKLFANDETSIMRQNMEYVCSRLDLSYSQKIKQIAEEYLNDSKK